MELEFKKFDAVKMKISMKQGKREAQTFSKLFIVTIIFGQRSEGKRVGCQSGPHNELRKVKLIIL